MYILCKEGSREGERRTRQQKMVQTILFVQEPSTSSHEWQKLLKDPHFNVVKYILSPSTTTKESFLQFLTDQESIGKPVSLIFAGFPAFHPIGGLTKDIIESRVFHTHVKKIALCSRGMNFIDLDTLTRKEYGIQLYNYDDSPEWQVGNDVADCAMWHILEGFRKFSLFMKHTINTNHSIKSRQIIRDGGQTPKFAFGHEISDSAFVMSPRGANVLIMGMGSVGLNIAKKLYYGLGMNIHYTKRQKLTPKIDDFPMQFHSLSDLSTWLPEMDAIIVALPGTPDTYHIIDSQFLAHCKPRDLILVNVGRATVMDMDAMDQALQSGQIRHLGMDVFTHEPEIDSCLLSPRNQHKITITPHIGSGTKQVFDKSTDQAILHLTQTDIELE